ncbi:hypothetical protein OIE66_11170 [Nonomuraea sp. NBC_01738]|uniref:NACHT domain-containing protein n=1 Tax=Nonomuraea sp. NBC_01738 TaxID=2976003 RepID=UPI002E14CE32|nr:hypothetical protein OIE66_11170 [Nonomuraea sp. NBC_01738]
MSAEPSSFERGPGRRTTWLALVDGLDEIADVTQRGTALARLARHLGQPPGAVRLVVLGRPLPGAEAGELRGEHVREFQLRPLDSQGLQLLSQRWFAALDGGGADPETSGRFLLQAEGALPELIRVPLIATMCMLIYEDDRVTDLPSTRAELYASFAELLGADPEPSELWTWLRPYLREFVAAISLDYVDGRSGNLFQLAVSWVELHMPKRPRYAWTGDLRAVLLSTGFIVTRGNTLEFVHPSFAEYFAAGARDFEPEAWLAEVQDRSRRSLALFTLARVGSEYDRWLGRLLERERPEALLAAGHMVADGLFRSQDVRKLATGRLFGLLAEPEHVVEGLAVIVPLCRYPDVRQRLAGVSGDRSAEPWLRARAADALADSDRDEGFRLLRGITGEAGLRTHPVCGWAAARLAARGDVFGAYISDRARREVTLTSEERAGRIAFDAMRLHADDGSVAAADRLRAMLFLVAEGSDAYYQEARTLLLDRSVGYEVRLQAAQIMLARGADQATELLLDLLYDRGTAESIVAWAAEELVRQDRLDTLSEIIGWNEPGCRGAVTMLARHGGERELALAETWLLQKGRRPRQIAECRYIHHEHMPEPKWEKSGPAIALLEAGKPERLALLAKVVATRKTVYGFQMYLREVMEGRPDVGLLRAMVTSPHLEELYAEDLLKQLCALGDEIGLDGMRRRARRLRTAPQSGSALSALARYGTADDLALIERVMLRRFRPARSAYGMLEYHLPDRPDGLGLPVLRRVLLSGRHGQLFDDVISTYSSSMSANETRDALFAELLLHERVGRFRRRQMVKAVLERRAPGWRGLLLRVAESPLTRDRVRKMLVNALWNDHSAEAGAVLRAVAATGEAGREVRRSAVRALMERGDEEGPALLRGLS